MVGLLNHSSQLLKITDKLSCFCPLCKDIINLQLVYFSKYFLLLLKPIECKDLIIYFNYAFYEVTNKKF